MYTDVSKKFNSSNYPIVIHQVQLMSLRIYNIYEHILKESLTLQNRWDKESLPITDLWALPITVEVGSSHSACPKESTRGPRFAWCTAWFSGYSKCASFLRNDKRYSHIRVRDTRYIGASIRVDHILLLTWCAILHPYTVQYEYMSSDSSCLIPFSIGRVRRPPKAVVMCASLPFPPPLPPPLPPPPPPSRADLMSRRETKRNETRRNTRLEAARGASASASVSSSSARRFLLRRAPNVSNLGSL